MRFLIGLMMLVVVGCAANPNAPSSLNHAAGTYGDFADYMIATDPQILLDAQAAGGDRTDAHCAAAQLGRRIHGVDYDLLSAAVAGRAVMTIADERRARAQQDRFLAYTESNRAEATKLLDTIMSQCLGS